MGIVLLGGKHKDLVSRFEFKEKKIKAKKDNHYRQTGIGYFGIIKKKRKKLKYIQKKMMKFFKEDSNKVNKMKYG